MDLRGCEREEVVRHREASDPSGRNRVALRKGHEAGTHWRVPLSGEVAEGKL